MESTKTYIKILYGSWRRMSPFRSKAPPLKRPNERKRNEKSSITSYVLAHAICDGYINSIDERLNWPMFSKTLYNGQSIRDLINMKAGDRHTVNRASSHVMGSSIGARDMDLYQLSNLLKDTQKKGHKIFYNNVLADITAGYLAFRTGDDYNKLMRKVFNDKVKIEHQTKQIKTSKPKKLDQKEAQEK